MISVRNSRTLSSNSKFTKVELWYEIHNGIPEGAGGREDKTPDPALLPIRLVGGPAPSSGPAPLYLASLSIALRPRSGACALWTTGRCDGQLSDLPAIQLDLLNIFRVYSFCSRYLTVTFLQALLPSLSLETRWNCSGKTETQIVTT
ncbi:uncharacterized protein LOC122543919 isoform X4 [Chiloscyllium plagiosum]|uniref:uncharacterized protein LOC122543919 isoform X4 n=1 Tax=Chiloscyllium plagiosum TaxID=36176 RepID=UPI001CB7B284|nr:uncharacterized protein LOC122543919 isoform X4 [Chiloscyllium plagiosum]